MQEIKLLIANSSVGDARSALYYVGRYLKIAPKIDEYEKDFFEEENKSAPSEFVRGLAWKIIHFIEDAAGQTANEFDDQTFIVWIDRVTSVERDLDPELTGEAIERAMQILETMKEPPIDPGTNLVHRG